MMNLSLITPLILCILSWISVSVSEFQTLRGRPGEEVTMLISNISKFDSVTFWFRQINKTKVRCVSVMIKSDSAADFCDGYNNGNFEMRSNISNLFLKIKQVDLSDSGLYVCGFYTKACYITFLFPEADGVTKLMNVILGVLTGFLVIIIGLVLKFTKPWSLDSKVNDAALSVYSRTMRNGRPASEREVETRVFYCASR
uniref:Immunoglobulin subtype domain-containing protein n=1 Tax=Seriola dumerili TaxID=41447 RepID=A0A3B4V5V9_SERDU